MNRIIKFFGIIIVLNIICFNAHSQDADPFLTKFNQSFITSIKYPPDLIDQCLPTVTLLKIYISKNGIAKNSQLSDSADPLFNKEFLLKEKSLNIAAITKYATRKKLKNISLLIPVYFYFKSNTCELKDLDIEQLKKYMQFRKITFGGKAIILPPIVYSFIFNRDI